jgi:pimeloyl-ACP methyl ester carboxylesterase
VRLRYKILIGLLVVLLVGPFLIPVNSSGTLTKEEAAAEVWGSESKFVELANQEVHYVTAGNPSSKRLIVLLHGFGASAFSYKDVLAPLGEIGFVIAYDRTGFGFTNRPTSWSGENPYGIQGQIALLDELVTEFGANKEVIILGHSAGGNIAATYAEAHPEKVQQLILFAPAVGLAGAPGAGFNWIFNIPQIDHLGPLLVSTIATSGLDLLYESYVDDSKITDEVLAGYTAPLKVEGWEKAFWLFNKAPRTTNIGERISELRMPTLVITGDADTVVATSDSVLVSQRMPNAKLVEISGTGHLPNEEKPEEFASEVIKFIEEVGQ